MDIGNAYLETETKAKLCFISGSEFKGKKGHLLTSHKALYGLCMSGLRWHERFADCLRNMHFIVCMAEPAIWIRANNNVYEYVAVYLMI